MFHWIAGGVALFLTGATGFLGATIINIDGHIETLSRRVDRVAQQTGASEVELESRYSALGEQLAVINTRIGGLTELALGSMPADRIATVAPTPAAAPVQAAAPASPPPRPTAAAPVFTASAPANARIVSVGGPAQIASFAALVTAAYEADVQAPLFVAGNALWNSYVLESMARLSWAGRHTLNPDFPSGIQNVWEIRRQDLVVFVLFLQELIDRGIDVELTVQGAGTWDQVLTNFPPRGN